MYSEVCFDRSIPARLIKRVYELPKQLCRNVKTHTFDLFMEEYVGSTLHRWVMNAHDSIRIVLKTKLVGLNAEGTRRHDCVVEPDGLHAGLWLDRELLQYKYRDQIEQKDTPTNAMKVVNDNGNKIGNLYQEHARLIVKHEVLLRPEFRTGKFIETNEENEELSEKDVWVTLVVPRTEFDKVRFELFDWKCEVVRCY